MGIFNPDGKNVEARGTAIFKGGQKVDARGRSIFIGGGSDGEGGERYSLSYDVDSQKIILTDSQGETSEVDAGATEIGFLPFGHDDHSGATNEGEIIIGRGGQTIYRMVVGLEEADELPIDGDNSLIDKNSEGGELIFQLSSLIQDGDKRPPTAEAVFNALSTIPAGGDLVTFEDLTLDTPVELRLDEIEYTTQNDGHVHDILFKFENDAGEIDQKGVQTQAPIHDGRPATVANFNDNSDVQRYVNVETVKAWAGEEFVEESQLLLASDPSDTATVVGINDVPTADWLNNIWRPAFIPAGTTPANWDDVGGSDITTSGDGDNVVGVTKTGDHVTNIVLGDDATARTAIDAQQKIDGIEAFASQAQINDGVVQVGLFRADPDSSAGVANVGIQQFLIGGKGGINIRVLDGDGDQAAANSFHQAIEIDATDVDTASGVAAFDTDTPYSTGDNFTFNNILYKINGNITDETYNNAQDAIAASTQLLDGNLGPTIDILQLETVFSFTDATLGQNLVGYVVNTLHGPATVSSESAGTYSLNSNVLIDDQYHVITWANSYLIGLASSTSTFTVVEEHRQAGDAGLAATDAVEVIELVNVHRQELPSENALDIVSNAQAISLINQEIGVTYDEVDEDEVALRIALGSATNAQGEQSNPANIDGEDPEYQFGNGHVLIWYVTLTANDEATAADQRSALELAVHNRREFAVTPSGTITDTNVNDSTVYHFTLTTLHDFGDDAAGNDTFQVRAVLVDPTRNDAFRTAFGFVGPDPLHYPDRYHFATQNVIFDNIQVLESRIVTNVGIDTALRAQPDTVATDSTWTAYITKLGFGDADTPSGAAFPAAADGTPGDLFVLTDPTGHEAYDANEADLLYIGLYVLVRNANGTNEWIHANEYKTTPTDLAYPSGADNGVTFYGNKGVQDVAQDVIDTAARVYTEMNTALGLKQDTIDADNAGAIRTTLNVADGADVTPTSVPTSTSTVTVNVGSTEESSIEANGNVIINVNADLTPANGIYLEATTANNGMIPKIVNGAWALATDETSTGPAGTQVRLYQGDRQQFTFGGLEMVAGSAVPLDVVWVYDATQRTYTTQTLDLIATELTGTFAKVEVTDGVIVLRCTTGFELDGVTPQSVWNFIQFQADNFGDTFNPETEFPDGNASTHHSVRLVDAEVPGSWPSVIMGRGTDADGNRTYQGVVVNRVTAAGPPRTDQFTIETTATGTTGTGTTTVIARRFT